MIEGREADDELTNPLLNFGGQAPDGCVTVAAVLCEALADAERLAEVDEHVGAVAALRGIRDPDGLDPQAEGATVAILDLQRHSSRTGLHRPELLVVVAHAFGKDPNRPAGLEHSEAVLERVRHGLHRRGVVLPAVDGDNT